MICNFANDNNLYDASGQGRNVFLESFQRSSHRAPSRSQADYFLAFLKILMVELKNLAPTPIASLYYRLLRSAAPLNAPTLKEKKHPGIEGWPPRVPSS